MTNTQPHRLPTPRPLGRLLAWGALVLLVGSLLSLSARAMFLNIEIVPQHGAVMARGMAKIEGQPVLVTYDEQGGEVDVLELDYPLEELMIISKEEYQYQVDLLDDWMAEHEDGLAQDAKVMPRAQFLGQNYTLADGQTSIAPPNLHHAVKSVVVRGQSQRYREDPDDLVLLSFTVDLSEDKTLGGNTRSVVLNPEGQLIHESPHLIAPRTGFYGNPGDPQHYHDGPGHRRTHDDEIFGPVQGALVKNYWPGGADVVGEDGRYSFSFILPPCPPGGFDFTADTHVELHYKSFNPHGSSVVPYYLRKQGWAYCPSLPPPGFDLASLSNYLNSMAILATSADPVRQVDFYVDVMFLTGTMRLANPDDTEVELGSETTYEVFETDHHDTPIAATWYDFDGDGEPEMSKLGRVEEVTLEDGTTVELFYEDAEGDQQGIYLSSNPDPNSPPEGYEDAGPQPDLVRLANTQTKLESTGFLSTISKDDLQNTDLLVFRESTGELVMERRGLRDEEIDGGTQIGEAEEQGNLYYRLMIRGPKDHAMNIGGGVNRSDTWGEWAKKYHLSEPFREREANHLRSGEWINLVAINRATGYMANQRIQLTDASAVFGSFLHVPLEEMVLRPPNLKVWAERRFDVEHGLTQGEERRYLIGAEGASLTSDMLIEVYTEWYDHTGRPLPDGLGEADGGDYGLTGRLAKVTAPNEISETADGGQALFPIAPGRQTQVLQIKDNLTTSEHYYIHVSGTQSTETPEFGNPQSGSLSGRPALLTPFLAPLYDEETDWEGYRFYREVRRDREEAEESTEDLMRPTPYYAWLYRPEYQFSRYSLEMEEINRWGLDEDGEEELVENILGSELPVIATADLFIEALYSLISSNFERLTPIDGLQELILALGEEEMRIEIGPDQTLRFDNLEHLASLDPEDFLSMRLYTNQDAGNVLWEYAFLMLAIDLVDDSDLIGEDIVYVSADDPEIDLAAWIIGYANISEERKEQLPDQVRWRVVKGNATVDPVVTSLEESGAAVTRVKVSPQVGNVVQVEAMLIGDDDTPVTSFDIGVIAGKPAQISMAQTGTTFIKGIGSVEVSALVLDHAGNMVTDGTGVHFRESGHINLKEVNGLTENGLARATLNGGSVSGVYSVRAEAGNLQAQQLISVQPLEVRIEDLPARMEAGEEYELKAVLSGGTGSTANIFVDIGADGGVITALDTYTDSAGEVAFSYLAPNEPGYYNLAAKVDINQPVLHSVEVVERENSDGLMQEQYYLISGIGDEAVTDFQGRTANINTRSALRLDLEGEPGVPWEVPINNYHLINREPLVFFRFDDPFWDQGRRFSAGNKNVSSEPGFIAGLRALQFEGSSSVWYMNLSAGDLSIGEPAYHFWLKPTNSGRIMSVANDTLIVRYEEGRLIATLATDDGPLTLTLDEVVAGRWQSVAVGVRENDFYLASDKTIITAPMNGGIIHYPTIGPDGVWLSLGQGFSGELTGLRLYDWATAPLIVAEPSSGTFDAEGRATTTVTLSANTAQQSTTMPAVTVGLGNSDEFSLNILSRPIINRFGELYLSVQRQSTSSSIDSDDILSSLPMPGIFPDPKRGAISLAQRYSVSSNTEVARETVIANLGWLSFEPRYADLHNKIHLLQQHLSDENNPHLSEYAAEYLQEAMVQASYGNPFWLHAMVSAFSVWAEMAELQPDKAALIARAIGNRTDFWSWIRILSLPADGWATDIIPIPSYNLTCDQVARDINVDTPLAASMQSCRATGGQMALLLDTVLAIDPEIEQAPELLTVYLTTLLTSLKEMPLEYTRIFASIQQSGSADRGLAAFPQAYAAGPAAAGRIPLEALKQAMRRAGGAAPANFLAFMQGGTTSRVDRTEMLVTLAYLSARLDTGECDNCKKLNQQVSRTVAEDMATWFMGIGLAKRGDIAGSDHPEARRRKCTISNQAHGKGFELVATAAYHALYEFGSSIGLEADRYQILLSDPRSKTDRIDVPIMRKAGSDLIDNGPSPFQRKPDLVLAGEGEGERYWIELKSWRYNSRYYNQAQGELKSNLFPLWDGESLQVKGKRDRRSPLRYTTLAHRQSFIDYAASSSALDDEWREFAYRTSKPASHRAWFQIWEPGRRHWTALRKQGGRYVAGRRQETLYVATPWIEPKNITGGVVRQTTPQFRALQRFLATAPTGLDNNTFESTTGLPVDEYNKNYRDKQVTQSFGEFRDATVLPFTRNTFFAVEAGEGAAQALWSHMVDELGGGDLVDILKGLDADTITQEQIEMLQEKLLDELVGLLGPFDILMIDIPYVSSAVNKMVDFVFGAEVEGSRQFVANYKLPEGLFENACEAP